MSALVAVDSVSWWDKRKIDGLTWMRRRHTAHVEHNSDKTFRVRKLPVSAPPRVLPAANLYKGMSWLPPSLVMPEKLPKEAKLPRKYVVPYYGVSKLIWNLYHRCSMKPGIEWSPDMKWNGNFRDRSRGWAQPTNDAAFAQLRLQGPNPFTLKRDPDGAETDFILDFTSIFKDLLDEAVVARFSVVDKVFTATSVDIGSKRHVPNAGTAEARQGWDDAKRIVNGLDARYVTFIRHLLDTHLLVGTAYSISALNLAGWHPLRPMLDFFTYGTLHVNHMAYQSLMQPISYFVKSNFVSQEDCYQLVVNATSQFDFNEWIAPRDIERRGLKAIPGHPYVDDAATVWPAIKTIVCRHLTEIDLATDDQVLADEELAAWHRVLVSILPSSDTVPALDGVDSLVDLLTALIYNNVIHEICGNLSPLLDSHDPEDRVTTNFENLRALARNETPRPTATSADVFLIDQAAYVSGFHVKGNNLLKLNVPAVVDDPKLASCLTDLQATLSELDDILAVRNGDRDTPFDTMQPSNWEASISF
ncbi:MAG: hypothetical protein ACI8Y4_000509 [Candidatus Poriferisodalaceae bacterium]|jgi:hypothetical protein